MDWLRPAGIEQIVKMTRPRRRNTLRPYRSESLPVIGITTVDETKYAVATHV